MDAIAAGVVEKIAAHSKLDSAGIVRETELAELEIHSLELAEIIFDIEDAYGIEVEMNTAEAWANLKNVGDVIDAVRALVKARV